MYLASRGEARVAPTSPRPSDGWPMSSYLSNSRLVTRLRGSKTLVRWPSLYLATSADGIGEGCGEEPVGPLLSELSRVGEHDLDLRVAHLQAGQHIPEPGT
jgi:hypothetical protein